MILENRNATIAFRCPSCGQAIFSGVNIFRLSGDMLRLRCPDCDESLTMVRTNDKKIRLSVPCALCANPHQAVVSEAMLLSQSLFAIPCPFSGIDIFFAGEEKQVAEAVDKSSLQLQNLFEQAGVEDLSLLHPKDPEELPDPAVEHIVRFLLCELEDEGKISCYCKDEGELPLYDFQVLSERVRVFCHCCNAETYLPLRSEADAEHFINIDKLELK